MSMNTSGSGGASEVTNEINVTPFCDICLVLLIIFMIITPMLQKGVPVVLPKARNPVKQPEKADNIDIAVQMEKTGQIKIYYGRKWVPSDVLREKLEADYARNPAREVYIKGFHSTDFGHIKEVLRDIQSVGFKQVGLVVTHVDAKGNPVVGNSGNEPPGEG